MSVTIQTKVTGTEDIKRKIDELFKKNVGALRGVLQKSVKVVETRAKKRVPVLTGRLQSSITTEVRKINNGFDGRVGSDVEYASSVEFGGKPTTIEVSQAWAKKHSGIPKSRLHGTQLNLSGKAKPYLFPAMKRSQGDIIKFLTNAIKAVR